jgi:hypothetical protein
MVFLRPAKRAGVDPLFERAVPDRAEAVGLQDPDDLGSDRKALRLVLRLAGVRTEREVRPISGDESLAILAVIEDPAARLDA